MATKVQQAQRQQAGKQASGFDLERAQKNIGKVLSAVQAGALQFIANEPTASTSPGKRLQAWLGQDGTLKICVANNSWVKYSGASF